MAAIPSNVVAGKGAASNPAFALLPFLLGGGGTAGMLPILLPFIMSLFGGKKKPPDINALYAAILPQLQLAATPTLQAAQRGAMRRGTAVGQTVSAGLGRAGAGSTGVGTLQRGLAASTAGAEADQTYLDFQKWLMDTAGQMAREQAGINVPFANQPSTFGNLQAALGGAMLNDQNPFQQLADAYMKRRGG